MWYIRICFEAEHCLAKEPAERSGQKKNVSKFRPMINESSDHLGTKAKPIKVFHSIFGIVCSQIGNESNGLCLLLTTYSISIEFIKRSLGGGSGRISDVHGRGRCENMEYYCLYAVDVRSQRLPKIFIKDKVFIRIHSISMCIYSPSTS